MNALLLGLAFSSIGACASYNDAASEVYSAASVLANEVNSWSSAKGVQAALGVQNDFPHLSSALNDLENSVQRASADDIDIQATHHFTSQLSNLLESLTEKATDFSALSLGGIVSGDLKSVSAPATDIINDIVKLVGSDQSRWNELQADLTKIEQRLNSANKAYGLNTLQFGETPSFGAGSASTTAARTAVSSGSSISDAASAPFTSETAERNQTTKDSSFCKVTMISSNAGSASLPDSSWATVLTVPSNSTSENQQNVAAQSSANSIPPNFNSTATRYNSPAIANAGSRIAIGACAIGIAAVSFLL